MSGPSGPSASPGISHLQSLKNHSRTVQKAEVGNSHSTQQLRVTGKIRNRRNHKLVARGVDLEHHRVLPYPPLVWSWNKPLGEIPNWCGEWLRTRSPKSAEDTDQQNRATLGVLRHRDHKVFLVPYDRLNQVT